MFLAKLLVFSLLFAVLIASHAGALSQPAHEASCIVEDIDTPTMPACVIRSDHGILSIPNKYWMHPSFNRYGLSPFTIQSFGRIYIDRKGRVLIRDVAFMDNAPDEFHHGLVRIDRNGLWGYANPSGRIVVPVKYSCAVNQVDAFIDVGPVVCVGCIIKRQGEYELCQGGQWFQTDGHGHLSPSHDPNQR